MKISQIVEILKENGKNVEIDEIIDMLDNIGELDEIGAENASGEFDVEEGIVKKLSKYYKIDIKPKKDKKPSKGSGEINKRDEGKNAAQGKFSAKNEPKIEDILNQEIKIEENKPQSPKKEKDIKNVEKAKSENKDKNEGKKEVKNTQKI